MLLFLMKFRGWTRPQSLVRRPARQPFPLLADGDALFRFADIFSILGQAPFPNVVCGRFKLVMSGIQGVSWWLRGKYPTVPALMRAAGSAIDRL
jgi:hypothetical protein